MSRKVEDILKMHMDEADDMTETEALVVAFNCIECDVMHGTPSRRRALAVIQKMIRERAK